MQGYWITFKQGSPGYCEGETEADAKQKAELLTGNTVATIKTLPYPATPIIYQAGDCPAFCYRPSACAGWTACPTNPSCTN